MVTGDAVLVSSTGQLGIMMSSARYKRDIHDMDKASSNLMKLRPVTFRYKNDPAGTLQYGLVAEEVARIYPELGSYGDAGKVQTVHYLTLIPMLLNELQKQNRELKNQTAANQRQAGELQYQARQLRRQSEQLSNQGDRVKRLTAQVADERAQRAAFEERLSNLEQTIQAKSGDGKLAAAR
jgi:FtsZ-binding cell division protein ZapB